jgi:ATP-dependent Clp protease ATP-binding subunit ClpA
MAGEFGMGGDDVFERFGQDLRVAVVLGSEEAKTLGMPEVRPEHLLLGLALHPEGPGARLLATHGLDEAYARERLDDWPDSAADREALAAIGIDLDQVKSSVEQAFGRGALGRARRRIGRGHIPFSPAAKEVLLLALRQHRRVAGNRRARLDGVHLVLGLLDLDDPGVRDLLERADVDVDQLRRDAESRLRGVA